MKRQLSQDELGDAFERYGALVRRRCQTVLRNRALGEDACQIVFLKLLRYGAAFREVESKIGFLYRMADNCCYELFRSGRVHVELAAADAIPSGARDQGHAEDRERVLEVMAELDAEMQRIAVMHFVDEMSQGHIAEALGYSRQTINARLATIRERAARVM